MRNPRKEALRLVRNVYQIVWIKKEYTSKGGLLQVDDSPVLAFSLSPDNRRWITISNPTLTIPSSDQGRRSI